MKFFKKRNSTKDTGAGGDALARKIADQITGKQRNLANYLNCKLRKLSVKSLLFLLIGFCAVFGGYLLYLLLRVFS